MARNSSPPTHTLFFSAIARGIHLCIRIKHCSMISSLFVSEAKRVIFQHTPVKWHFDMHNREIVVQWEVGGMTTDDAANQDRLKNQNVAIRLNVLRPFSPLSIMFRTEWEHHSVDQATTIRRKPWRGYYRTFKLSTSGRPRPRDESAQPAVKRRRTNNTHIESLARSVS